MGLLSFLTRPSLQRKMTLFLVPVLAVGLGLFSWLAVQALEQSRDSTLQERLTTARLTADRIDQTLAQALAHLKSAADAGLLGAGPEEFAQRGRALQEDYAQFGIQAVSVFTLDPRGRLTAAYPENAALGQDLLPYVDVGQRVPGDRAAVSGLVSSPLAPGPAVLLTAPVLDEQGRVLGALGVAVDVSGSNISGFIQPIKLGNTGYTEIVDGSGTVLTRTDPGQPPLQFEQIDHPAKFAALIQQGEATVTYCHRCHETAGKPERRFDLLAFAPLSTASWGVGIRQSEEEALAVTHGLQRRLILLGTVMLGAAVGLVWFTSRSVVRPIKMLTRASGRIADGNLEDPIPSSGQDEVAALARAFDGMRLKLKSSLEEIELWNREMESRVQQRTKEISCLLEVARTVSSTLEVDELLRTVVARVVDLLEPADAGCIFIVNDKRDRLVARAAAGPQAELFGQLVALPGRGIPGRVFETGTAQLYTDRTDIAEGMRELVGAHRLRPDLLRAQSAVCAPIVSRGQAIGALLLVNFRQPQPFAEADLLLVQAIADHIAVALENAQLLQRAEEARALREADRVRSQLISMVSHELRTPLTSIKGYATSLLREDANWAPDTRKEFLGIIDERADDLADLIDKLLQMSRLEAGALRVEREPVLANRMAEKMVEQVRARVPRHRFVLDFPSPFPIIEADPRYVEQVLQNLIENAVKYSPEGTTVTLRGAARDGMVQVSVSDEGLGIPQEHLEHIFQRFYRLDNDFTRRSSGSGLGLSIARGLVEAHGGRLWVESTQGRGSTFYFTLPAIVEPAEEAQEAGASMENL